MFLIGNSGRISKGKKSFYGGNVICYNSGTEGRRKLKFDEVSLQINQKFLRENQAKNFFDLIALLIFQIVSDS